MELLYKRSVIASSKTKKQGKFEKLTGFPSFTLTNIASKFKVLLQI